MAAAAASSRLTEYQFLCSICLDVFTDPVTIPCGHNFCKNCITQHWNINVQSQCPMCKELFDRRPELRVNTFISEMAASFRQSYVKEVSSSSEQQPAKPGEVLCDFCADTKLKALKFCLVCLASYCETHLEPHQRITDLKRHKLIDLVENLESRVCKRHERPPGLFCKTDQTCVCQFYTESSYKTHVSLKDEYVGKKAYLGKSEADVQHMIQQRRLKIQELKQSVKLSRDNADRETAVSVQVLTALIHSVERSLAELINIIKKKHATTEKQAEGFIEELEREISDLMKRSSELEQLSRTGDHLRLLQSSTFNPAKDWSKVKVHSSKGSVKQAVAQLEEKLRQKVKNLYGDVEMKMVQQCAVDVTLDQETANQYIILSDDGKQVRHGDIKQNLPDNPKRFSLCCVLAKQSFSTGRFYFEVQVKGKTAWILGVARESVNRKNTFSITSPTNGFWTVCLTDRKKYQALAGLSIALSLKSKPQKVGVFVDYEDGLVSFYDVDAADLIYSFIGCKFTEKLYPYFNPCSNRGGKNSTPLIICSTTDH